MPLQRFGRVWWKRKHMQFVFDCFSKDGVLLIVTKRVKSDQSLCV